MHATSPERGRRSIRHLVATVFALIMTAVAVLVATPAQAHTELVSSSPASGSKVSSAPERIELEFTEAVSPSLATVLLTVPEAGATELEVRAGARETVLLADIPPGGLPAGQWQVAYRVTSVDGHPIQGKLEFAVRATADAATRPSAPESASAASPTEDREPTQREVDSAAAPDSAGNGIGWVWTGPTLLIGFASMLAAVVFLGRLSRPAPEADRRAVADQSDADTPGAQAGRDRPAGDRSSTTTPDEPAS